jgi:hypothetical protein
VRWRRPAAIAVSALATLVVVLGGLVMLSRSALPGDSLYGVKRAAESVQLAFTSGNQDKAKLELHFAELRTTEVEKLLARPSAAGVGVQADAPVSKATAALIRSTLAAANEDVTEATRLLTEEAVRSRSTAPLEILKNWAPQQRARLKAIVRRLPTWLQTPAKVSEAVVQHAQQRVRQWSHTVTSCKCVTTEDSDKYGPIPCTTSCDSGPVTPLPGSTEPGSTEPGSTEPGSTGPGTSGAESTGPGEPATETGPPVVPAPATSGAADPSDAGTGGSTSEILVPADPPPSSSDSDPGDGSSSTDVPPSDPNSPSSSDEPPSSATPSDTPSSSAETSLSPPLSSESTTEPLPSVSESTDSSLIPESSPSSCVEDSGGSGASCPGDTGSSSAGSSLSR